jgi:hypothetical protein
MKTPEQVKANAMGFAEIINHKMTQIRDAPDERALADLWHSINIVRQYLDQMEREMLIVLEAKGAYTPSKFDITILENPKKKRKSRK